MNFVWLWLFVRARVCACVCACLVVAAAADNFCGLAVSKSLSAMHRVLIDSCTTALVWVVDTILYYATRQNDTPYGERWSQWSPLQLAGFAIMIWGTSTYYGVLKYPGLKYPTPPVTAVRG